VLGTVPYSAARGPWWDWLIAHAPRLNIGGFLATVAGFTPMDKISLWHGVAAVLLVLTIEASPALRRLLSRRLPQRLGLISFPLYLIHLPVLMSAGCGVFLLLHRAGFGYGAAVAISTMAFVLVAVGLAGLAVGLVERPAVRLAAVAGAVVQGGVERAIVAGRYAIRYSRRRIGPGRRSQARE
jgi:peptidoglycan/LPS O-acetylase OafA/YrhL